VMKVSVIRTLIALAFGMMSWEWPFTFVILTPPPQIHNPNPTMSKTSEGTSTQYLTVKVTKNKEIREAATTQMSLRQISEMWCGIPDEILEEKQERKKKHLKEMWIHTEFG
jgi:hypothetical protein